MEFVLTGLSGHISDPLSRELIQQEQEAAIISRPAEKQKEMKGSEYLPPLADWKMQAFLRQLLMMQVWFIQ